MNEDTKAAFKESQEQVCALQKELADARGYLDSCNVARYAALRKQYAALQTKHEKLLNRL